MMARRADTRGNARKATGWRQAIRLRRCGEVHRAAGGAYVVWGSAALASSSVQGGTYLLKNNRSDACIAHLGRLSQAREGVALDELGPLLWRVRQSAACVEWTAVLSEELARQRRGGGRGRGGGGAGNGAGAHRQKWKMKPAQRAALGLLLRKQASQRALFWERKTLLFGRPVQIWPRTDLIGFFFVSFRKI